VPGGRGPNDEGGLRGLRGAGPCAVAATRASGDRGQNLGAHRGERVGELIEERGCSLLYLPPYSPDFSPIEEAFSKIKALLRKAKARTRVALVEAIGRALEAVSTQDARGFFGHCGYLLGAQPS
jgi:hypothetical protein